MLEWLWFLNSHAELLYKHMLGDKDTFEMAFLLAGKQRLYNRVPHGPGLPLSQLQDPVYHPSFWQRNFGKAGHLGSCNLWLLSDMLTRNPACCIQNADFGGLSFPGRST